MELQEQLKRFEKEVEGKECAGLLLYHPGEKDFIQAAYGDGSNLLIEDRKRGFDDYIDIRIDQFDDGSWEEDVDGGIMLLNMKKDWDGRYNICQHIPDVLAFMEYDENVIVLQSFIH